METHSTEKVWCTCGCPPFNPKPKPMWAIARSSIQGAEEGKEKK